MQHRRAAVHENETSKLKMKPLHALIATLALAGCATGPLSHTGTFLPPQHYAALEKAPLCCESARDISYLKLIPGAEQAAAITPESPVFQFDHQRAYFAAFELPAGARTLVVKTYPVNMLWNVSGHVLLPSIRFLDADYRPLVTESPDYIARNPPLIGRSWGEATIAIPAAARFFVLFEGNRLSYLAWRDSEQPGGLLYVRSGPTGELSVLVPNA
ncbi:MAG TPA: hypothetical protein VHP37_30230 [Burkholderiales bacterium]|nr:hypothetical protein [Burkholderiales bacterium]